MQCTAAASLLVRVSDLTVGVFSCLGRLRGVLCACSEKGLRRQYEPSPLCISCIYRFFASMAMLFRESFHVTMWSALLSFSFQMYSLSDVCVCVWTGAKMILLSLNPMHADIIALVLIRNVTSF